MKKILLIANEKAGTGRIRYRLIDIMVRFMEAGYEVKVYPIEPEKGLTSEKVLAGDLSVYEKIVVAGGDGTMSHVIQALMARKQKNAEETIPALGYIPAGSTNDFAKSLGIPTSINGACRTILNGRAFAYDIGRFQNTWFNYVAAFGAFVPVSIQTKQKLKNSFGHGAYILEGVASFQENISFSCPMKVAWDNGKTGGERGQEEGSFVFGAVYNASSIGGIKIPNASRDRLQDGEMELLLIRKPETVEDRRTILASLRAGLPDGKEGSRFITASHVKNVRFISDRPIVWTLDGEDGGNHEDVAIGVTPQALRIMVPRKS